MPFAVRFGVSRRRRWLCAGLYALLVCCTWAYADGWLCAAMLFTCTLAAAYAWREPQPRIGALNIDARGQALLHFDGGDEALAADLLSGSLISRSLCVFKWRVDGRIHYQAVWPDMLPPDDWRRLRVWARFGQK